MIDPHGYRLFSEKCAGGWLAGLHYMLGMSPLSIT